MTIATAIVLSAVAVAAWGFPKEYGFEPDNRPQADCREEPCRATGSTTGFQVKQLRQADGDRVREFPTRVRRRNGWLVAFSLTLGDPNAQQRKFFNRLWGKPASARISVLDPAPVEGDRRNRRQQYRLHSQSQRFDVRPWFGKKAWFVLPRRMHVSRGQVIALTLPTWAPVLATVLRSKERWRSARNRAQRFRLHNQREVVKLQPFFGKKVWFTLKRRMHVRRGHIIALTLPTWGPVLATNLRGKERWRSSRSPKRCGKVERQAARQKIGKLRDYRCVHETARLLFTGLVIHKTPENKSR